MASFKITGQMKVKTLKEQFMNNFGSVLRVYYHHHFADDNATLAAIRGEGAIGGELDCGDNDIVGDFEEFMMALYGIEVQVASPDNSFLVDNDLKLCEVKNASPNPVAEKKGKMAFVFNGQTYKTKGRLCHAIVKYYAEQNPNAALVTLQRAFNTATNMIVATPEMAKTIVNSDKIPGGDFYMKEEDVICLKNCKVVVWKYWPEQYFKPFMEQVKALGYTVEEIEQ